MSLYKEKMEKVSVAGKTTRNHSKFRKWAKRQRNKMIRQNKKEDYSKFYKGWTL